MTLLHGFDISAYQPATAPSADFVIVKATEGASYTSSKFATQWASAGKNARVRGAYHFARPEESSAAAQADRFLSVVKPVPGEMVCLDLEASKLSQAKTNAWARDFGDRLRSKAPGVRTLLYMGAGYAANSTGKGLADHFDLWWYPQYPNAYQLVAAADVEESRAANRSSAVPGRFPIAAAASSWPAAVTPWLPPGVTATGWSTPHLWQFTDNHAGLDASVTALTLPQLARSGGQPDVKEGPMFGGGVPPLKVGERYSFTCPKGSVNIWGIWFDSPHRLTYRIAAHSQSGHGEIKADLVVGGPASDSDSWPSKATWKTSKTDVDAFSIELVKAEGPTPDWDPTQPGVDGKTVRPGWDSSHTA